MQTNVKSNFIASCCGVISLVMLAILVSPPVQCRAQDPVADAEIVNVNATVAQSPDAQTPLAIPETSAPNAASPTETGPTAAASNQTKTPKPDPEELEKVLWDYSPYQVLVLVASDDPHITADQIERPLRDYLDRDFSAIWRVTLSDASDAVGSMIFRDLDGIDYDTLTAADPVIAVKRDHADAIRIRVASNVGEFVESILATPSMIEEINSRGESSGDPSLGGVAERLTDFDGDPLQVAQKWADPTTEAVLVSRGLALTLTEPEAKMIVPPVDGLIAEVIEDFDKVYLVKVASKRPLPVVEVVEIDVLMRYFGSLASSPIASGMSVSETIGRTIAEAFSPVVRIDNAGQKTADGLLRAGGLIIDEDSPGRILVGDVLRPMTRKNDRNGNPFLIGMIDWAYLVADEIKENSVKMDFYAGRTGGLQGRKNNRTFRTGLKVRPPDDLTVLRLHAQGDPNFSLIGYEIYERELKSKSMSFVGRTDWYGRLEVEKTDNPLRLMYVKNGGAVLARLPMVPGLDPTAVADIGSDDLRLEAEAYIRGVQNAIIDLVAVRELFKARIRMRLERGEMDKAEELMEALRSQPSNEKLATDMGKKQAVFLKLLGSKNANQRRKVDQMFTSTRDTLSKFINPKLVRDLESDLIEARKNGGKLPRKPSEEADDVDDS